MGRLTIRITDLQGNVLAKAKQFENAQVEIPINDSRLASVTFSVYDPIVQYIQPLATMLHVVYDEFTDPLNRGNELVFWGYILTPTWSSDGTVSVTAHDPTLKLKHHYHRYGDFVVGTRTKGGYPMDAAGARMLIESATASEAQKARGVKSTGIYTGLFATHREAARPADLDKPKPGDGFWRTVERGTQVWESLTNIMEATEGFDIEFRPCDWDHPSTWSHPAKDDGAIQTRVWTPGFYCSMHCYERQGHDRTVDTTEFWPVVFHAGFGLDNLDSFTWAPNGDEVRNYAVVTYPGGERDSTDVMRKALAHIEQAWRDVGIYEEWVSSDQRDSQQILQAKADYIVKNRGVPPDYFTMEPKIEQSGFPQAGSPPRYATHFWVGDTVTAVVKKGYFVQSLNGRVMKVTLSQQDPAVNMKTSLDCIPTMGVSVEQDDA